MLRKLGPDTVPHLQFPCALRSYCAFQKSPQGATELVVLRRGGRAADTAAHAPPVGRRWEATASRRTLAQPAAAVPDPAGNRRSGPARGRDRAGAWHPQLRGEPTQYGVEELRDG